MFNYFNEIRNLIQRYEAKYFDHPKFVCLKMIIRHFEYLFKWNLMPRFKSPKDDKIHILFWLDGGLGDMLIALNYLLHVKAKFGDSIIIDLSIQPKFINEIKTFLYGQTYVNQILEYKKLSMYYDVVIELIRVPSIRYINHKKIEKLNKKVKEWLDLLLTFQAKYPQYMAYGTLSDNLVNTYSSIKGRKRIAQADIENYFGLTSKFKINVDNGDTILKKFNLKKCEYIILQVGAGLRSLNKGEVLSTREWPLEYYNRLISLLHHNYPNYKIVQTGYENGCHMGGVDLDLCGKTTFEEILALLKSAKTLISGECGNVHFRHFINQAPSVVLFGPTLPEIYAYKENINISARVCQGCEWLHKYWREECLKSKEDSFCMRSITPEMVIDEIKKNKVL